MTMRVGGSRRSQRVASVIQAELVRLMMEEIADPFLCSVRIQDVELSEDLKHARVFYSPMENPTPIKLKGLRRAWQRASPFLRRKLGDNLQLRSVPELEFQEDSHNDEVSRVFSILEHTNEPVGDEA